MSDDLPLPDVSNSAEGTSGQVNQFGVVHGDVHVGGASRPAALPLRVGLVPQRAGSFQHRGVDVPDRAVLTGMGGVGKTQLAADHAERLWHADEVRVLVWVTAASRDAIVSSYADAAAKITGRAGSARTFLEWLAETPEPWLVVLDDVQAPADLHGLWPPASGRVVVTTRRRDASLRGDRQVVDVDVFSARESVAYLTSAAGGADGAAELAEDLGHLPLALAQAAAYVLDRQLSCAQYRTRLAERRLAAVAPDDLPDEHRATVAATWSLSVERADSLRPRGVARPLLAIASVLDANGIPLEVFTSPAVLEFLGVDAADARDGLSCLHRLSLVTFDAEAGSVRVHALVQRATRDAADLDAVARVAADGLAQAWPRTERGTARGQALRANAEALLATGGDALWDGACPPVLFRRLESLVDVGLLAEAVDSLEGLLPTAVERLGPRHRDVLTIRRLLIHFGSETTDPAGAITAYRRLLPELLEVIGPDDVQTLLLRRGIACSLGVAGDPARAAADLGRLLTDQLRVLGRDHDETLTTRHNIAFWRAQAGDLAGALAEARRLLADRVDLLGHDDVQTMITRQNIADMIGKAGDPASAAEETRLVLADRSRVLGPDHAQTWMSRTSLSHWLYEAGQVAAAAAEARKLLEDRIRVLGPAHPEVASTRASFLYLAERSREAVGFWEAQRTERVSPSHSEPSDGISSASWTGYTVSSVASSSSALHQRNVEIVVSSTSLKPEVSTSRPSTEA